MDSVESLTGIDFYPALDDILEDKLEAYSDKSLWSFSNPNVNFGYTSDVLKCTSADTAIEVENNMVLININTVSIKDL